MLTFDQLIPQLAALLAFLSVPVLIAYLGAKHAVRISIAAFRGNAREMWQRHRLFLALVWSANLAMMVAFAYGWLWEADWVERVDVTIEDDVRDPLRLVHLSDLHLEGFGLREERALALVRHAQPDLVLLTGDYTSKASGDDFVQDVRRFVNALEPSVGVFAVPGNWDPNAQALFDGTDVHYLSGRSEDVRVGATRISITGSPFDTAPPPADEDADFAIFLQHSPDFLDETAAAGYELYLAGHTHGGQVRLPGFGAVITLSRYWKKYEAGLYREGDTYLYVNRGLGLEGGMAPRVRFFCRPEVTVIDVVPR